MKYYALSIANEFIDICKRENENVTMLKLMKLTYIAHGFILALLDKPVDGSKNDKVEAWKLGPVFPSVYYTFKHYGASPITDYGKDLEFTAECEFREITPRLTDEMEKKICEYVWRNYKGYSAVQLVELLHNPGTPWDMVFEPNKNKEIPDSYTKKYYNEVVSLIIQKNGL